MMLKKKKKIKKNLWQKIWNYKRAKIVEIKNWQTCKGKQTIHHRGELAYLSQQLREQV